MQEINLLQNKLKDKTNQWEKNNRVVIGLLSFVLLAVLGATGMIYMLNKNAEESKMALEQENISVQRKLDQMESEMQLAKGFQAQSKNIASLLQSHVIWSNLMKEMSNKTLKTSRYLGMTSDTTGLIHVEGITTDYTQLGKIILALETSEDVESVKLLNTGQSSERLGGILYSLDIKAKQEALIEQN
jgi:Tfp pilus assembly protein PilN